MPRHRVADARRCFRARLGAAGCIDLGRGRRQGRNVDIGAVKAGLGRSDPPGLVAADRLATS